MLGAVLGEDIVPVRAYFAGFYAGAKTARPSCTVIPISVNTFSDFTAGQTAAESLINDHGADVIFHAAGLTGVGALAAADTAGVYGIGIDTDQNPLYPDTVITSAIKNIDVAVGLLVDEFFAGTLHGGGTELFGLSEGAVGLAPYRSFPTGFDVAALESEVNAAAADIADGVLFVPFSMDEVLKIGVVGPRSGENANLGNTAYRAAKLCSYSMNYSSGEFPYFVALEVEDDYDDGAAGAVEAAAQRMIDEGVVGVIGHSTSGATETALMNVYTEPNDIPVISPSATDPYLTWGSPYPNFFRTIQHLSDRAYYVVHIADTLEAVASDAENFAIIYAAGPNQYTDFAGFMADAVVDVDGGNGTVVLNEGISFDFGGDYSGVITALQDLGSGVDVILCCGPSFESAEILGEIRNAGITIPFLHGLGNYDYGEFLIYVNDYEVPQDNAYIIDEFDPEGVPEGQGVLDEYRDIYGVDPGMYYLNAYAATQALVWSVTAPSGSTNPEDIISVLKTGIFENTVIGTIDFNDEGDVSGDRTGFNTYSIVDGAVQLFD